MTRAATDTRGLPDGFFRYLVVAAPEQSWGLSVTGVGHTRIGPGSAYPPMQHPTRYQFDWSRGRTLGEFQVVYLSRGAGVYADAHCASRPLAAGDCFLLRPGLWHRYRPDPTSGWDEHWFSCSGPVAERILDEPFFSADEPILVHGLDPGLVDDFRAMAGLALDLPPGHASLLAALAYRVIARLRARQLTPHPSGDDDLVRLAMCRMHAHVGDPRSVTVIAESLGVPYERLRKAFKHQVGRSPKQYLLDLRLRHVQDMLSGTDATLADIAGRLGFGSAEHLSRLFTRHLGLSPGRWRIQSHRG